MRDRKTLFAFLFLIILVGILIWLSLAKMSADEAQDNNIKNLASLIESVNQKTLITKPVAGIDGKTPVKGVDYVDGKDGANGEPGKDGTNGIDGKNGKDGVNGSPGVKGDKGDPAPELDISCVDSIIMKKYSGDDFWQPSNIKCESNNE